MALVCVQLLLDHKFFMRVAVVRWHINRLHLAVLVVVVEVDGMQMDKGPTHQVQVAQAVEEEVVMIVQAALAALA